METLALAVLLLVLLGIAMQVVNRRFERAKSTAETTADTRVDEAWESFGGDVEPSAVRADLEALLRVAPVESLERKSSLVRVAIMCTRGEHYAPLPRLAARAVQLAGSCGETAALAGLSEAYTGDPAKARVLIADARAGLAGCATCGAGIEGSVLLQELALAYDALESPAPSADTNALHVRVGEPVG